MNSLQETWRMFIAIESPLQVKEALKRAQESLRSTVDASVIRWAQPDQFHLTLRFLGNVPVSRVESLTSRLTEACRGFGPLRLRVENIGFFPNGRSPRVIWAGVTDEQERLGELFQMIAEATGEFCSDERDKKFHGHITMGRVKQLSRRDAVRLAEAAQNAAKVFGEWEADKVCLIRSELSSSGPVYTSLAKPPLI